MNIEVKKTGNNSRMTITVRDDGDDEIRAQIHIDAQSDNGEVKISVRRDAEEFKEYTLKD